MFGANRAKELPMSAIHTISSNEFGHNVSNAKQLAKQGPLFITNRGESAFVLMNIRDYHELAGERSETLRTALAMPSAADDFEFDPPKARIGLRIPSFADDE
jgi:PHD/YefM family antitoxin component YafN of YafNO toxin-antitoxin module